MNGCPGLQGGDIIALIAGGIAGIAAAFFTVKTFGMKGFLAILVICLIGGLWAQVQLRSTGCIS